MMKRHRHTPEQIVRKLREGDRMLNDGVPTRARRHEPSRVDTRCLASRGASRMRSLVLCVGG